MFWNEPHVNSHGGNNYWGTQEFILVGVYSVFDGAKSIGMDNTSAIDAKTKQPINANDEVFALAA
jgi:hypothetical protein